MLPSKIFIKIFIKLLLLVISLLWIYMFRKQLNFSLDTNKNNGIEMYLDMINYDQFSIRCLDNISNTGYLDITEKRKNYKLHLNPSLVVTLPQKI